MKFLNFCDFTLERRGVCSIFFFFSSHEIHQQGRVQTMSKSGNMVRKSGKNRENYIGEIHQYILRTFS